MEGKKKKLKGNFVMDTSGWQLLNPLIKLNIIKIKMTGNCVVLI